MVRVRVPSRSPFAGLLALIAALLVALVASPALAAGSARLSKNTVDEVGGAWRIRMSLELPKAPTLAHVPMKFVFTQTMSYERSLVDNSKEPVTNHVAVRNQPPKIESMDVDFSNAMGKIWKGTSFDFSLPRDRGYEAGEWKLQVRTADGTDIGSGMNLVLKGDNPVVDRRSITFDAKKKGIEKVDNGAGDKDANKPPKEGGDDTKFAMQSQEVEASGPPPSFVGKEGFQPTEEEKIKERPKGCGCDVPGARVSSRETALAALALAFGLVFAARRGRARGRR